MRTVGGVVQRALRLLLRFSLVSEAIKVCAQYAGASGGLRVKFKGPLRQLMSSGALTWALAALC